MKFNAFVLDAETSSAWRNGSVLVFLSSRTCFGISFLGLKIEVLRPHKFGEECKYLSFQEKTLKGRDGNGGLFSISRVSE